jgi:hypothetical protein
MTIKLWDKIESINGISAEDYLTRNETLRNVDVLLLLNDNNRIREVLDVDELRNLLNLDNSISVQDVGNAYLNYLNKINTTNNSMIDLLKSMIE